MMVWTRDVDNKLKYYGEEVGEIGMNEEGEMIARLSPNYKMYIDLTDNTMLELKQLLEAVKLNWKNQL